jgi:hypothetical protein
MLYRSIPSRRIESKLHVTIATFRDWRQLEEIPSDNKLYAAKGPSVVPNTASDLLELVV